MLHPDLGGWMVKAETCGVQAEQGFGVCEAGRWIGCFRVRGLAHDWKARGVQVQADLVGPPRAEQAAHQAVTGLCMSIG